MEQPRGPKKSSMDGAGLPSSWHFVTFSLYFSTFIRLSKYQLFSCESMPHVIYAGSGSNWPFDEDDDGFELFDDLNELWRNGLVHRTCRIKCLPLLFLRAFWRFGRDSTASFDLLQQGQRIGSFWFARPLLRLVHELCVLRTFRRWNWRIWLAFSIVLVFFVFLRRQSLSRQLIRVELFTKALFWGFWHHYDITSYL